MIRKTICLTLFVILTFIPLLASQSGAVATRGIKVTAIDKSTGKKKEVDLYREAYAVIIGIDHYENLKYDQQLRYAEWDAKGVEDVLKKNFKFDKIITLYNKEATKDNIMKVLSGDLSKLSKDDSVFVFWAGHGYTEKTDLGDLGYLIPFDGTFKESEMYKNISMTMIKNNISKRIPAKHVFFVVDACFSGLLLGERGPSRKSGRDFDYLKEITKEMVRQVLTAGSKGQKVLDGGPKGHSVFTGRFIEILENTDDFITASEISAVVKEKVFSDAKASDHPQTPKSGELYGLGDYVFVPSLEQKVEDTKIKVANLQKELERLDNLKKAAGKAKDERARRRAELEKRAIQAKLIAEQLRQQALDEDRRKREQEERERLEREKELTERKKAEKKRLAFLVDKVADKRKEMGSITISSLSPEATITEMREIEAKIKKIRADFRKELSDSKKLIFDRTEKTLKKLRQERQDEFETEQEFRERIEKKIDREYEKQVSPFIETLKKLSRNEFTLTGNKLELVISRYNPSSSTFPMNISAKQSIKGIMVAANADIHIPRQEAKAFKQHFQNNILRPELSGHFDSLENFRVMKAYVIDDATNKQYNLSSHKNIIEYDAIEYTLLRGHQEGRYIAYDNGIVYDYITGLEWFTSPMPDRRANSTEYYRWRRRRTESTWYDGKEWVENLSLDGHWWRLPSLGELKSLYHKGMGKPDNFGNPPNITPLLTKYAGKIWADATNGSPSAPYFAFQFGRHDGPVTKKITGYSFFAVRYRGASQRKIVTHPKVEKKRAATKKKQNTIKYRMF